MIKRADGTDGSSQARFQRDEIDGRSSCWSAEYGLTIAHASTIPTEFTLVEAGFRTKKCANRAWFVHGSCMVWGCFGGNFCALGCRFREIAECCLPDCPRPRNCTAAISDIFSNKCKDILQAAGWHAQTLWEGRGLGAIATPFEDSGMCHTDCTTPARGFAKTLQLRPPRHCRRAIQDAGRRRQARIAMIHISRTGP